MSSFADSFEDSSTQEEPVPISVNTILNTTCPKHIDGDNLVGLNDLLSAVVGLGRYILKHGTGDSEKYTMYEKSREKFCAYYPRHLYESMHEMVSVSIQFPSQLILYDASRQFGMGKNQLKRYPKKHAQYMRTQKLVCKRCLETIPGTAFSDGRLIGKRARQICKQCVEEKRAEHAIVMEVTRNCT